MAKKRTQETGAGANELTEDQKRALEESLKKETVPLVKAIRRLSRK